MDQPVLGLHEAGDDRWPDDAPRIEIPVRYGGEDEQVISSLGIGPMSIEAPIERLPTTAEGYTALQDELKQRIQVDRPRHLEKRACLDSRRGDFGARQRVRSTGAIGVTKSNHRTHCIRDRPPAFDGAARRPYRGAGKWHHQRHRGA